MTNKHSVRLAWLIVTAGMLTATAQVSSTSVIGSPHDLSASSGSDVCRYCHTPHGVSPKTVLWNQPLSTTVYKIYQSSSLEAVVGQPTGSSKLCLSCHDGTVALPVAGMGSGMGGGATLKPGQANLGTDLSDDHPISFFYSDALAAKDPQIRPASTLPEALPLDRGNELQCTTCHDAHNNQYGDFLTMPNERSAMCTSCHDLDGWRGSVHEQSTASVAGSSNPYFQKSGVQMVSGQACHACHRPHSADKSERLLHYRNTQDNCLSCHDGSVAIDVRSQLAMTSSHDGTPYRGVHDLKESPVTSPPHVTCEDCHNPHAIRDMDVQAPLASPTMNKVSGVTASGGMIQHARYEYEVCFKCHGDNPSRVGSRITRDVSQTNTRLEFDASGPSFHPVVSMGVSKNVPSLRLPMTVASVIYCTDCHASSDSRVKGPHGSMFSPLLKANYDTSDFTTESESAYALCYQCHSRNSIVANESFPGHKRHLDQRIPCSACHDAHGISSAQGDSTNHSHLINFDRVIVDKDPNTGMLKFEDLGIQKGQCTLQCHGKQHSPLGY
jgi:predicted CXXCH cytochrome family protein